MKHINRFCLDCNVKLTDNNWLKSQQKNKLYRCDDCRKAKNNIPENQIKRNSVRMFVNGKYIPQSHPLHKPGHYKTFEDAAFQSLSRYSTSTQGEVYILTNPAWQGWIKVGMAVDAEDRCKSYQTSSPMRDYELQYKKFFTNRRVAESKAHKLCTKNCKERNGEWFQMSITKAKELIDLISEKTNEKTKAA